MILSILFEFKRDASAEARLRQIGNKDYARQYAADHRKLYKTGVNFSSGIRQMDGWKVEES